MSALFDVHKTTPHLTVEEERGGIFRAWTICGDLGL